MVFKTPITNCNNIVIGHSLSSLLFSYLKDYPIILNKELENNQFDFCPTELPLELIGFESKPKDLRVVGGTKQFGVTKSEIENNLILPQKLIFNYNTSEFEDCIKTEEQEIYNRDYIGPGVTVSNGEISNCAIIDDYPYSGQKSIEVDSGATTATITNCSFDFLNNSTNNIAITADDDNTPVFFANNTFKNCTPTNPTKVTQAILNTPDAQGNIVINN